MPKPTFLNLPDEKRERITELALDEFSTHPYRQASLSRIVARAGIAKGSMYQYFENKLDLYKWLVTDELGRRRTQWLESDSHQQQELNARGETGLFVEIEQLVVTRVGFMLAHPRLARLAASAMEPTADADLRELHGALRREHIDGLTERIDAARRSGEIRADLDPRTVAHLIDGVVLRGTTNAVLDRLGVDIQQFLSATTPRSHFDRAQCRELAGEALSLIRGGIASSARTSTAPGNHGNHDGEHETLLHPIAPPGLEWRASLDEGAGEPEHQVL